MSTYSKIGIIILIIVAIIGAATKILLVIRRKKLDGCHGFVKKEEEEPNKTDEWELL